VGLFELQYSTVDWSVLEAPMGMVTGVSKKLNLKGDGKKTKTLKDFRYRGSFHLRFRETIMPSHDRLTPA
jgi:hypothetical protein